MSDLSINVEKQSSLCGLSVRAATSILTAGQFLGVLTTGILYKFFLEDSTIISILIGIHMVCSLFALVFFIFCMLKRKFGTFYEVLLHGYLLSILMMSLTTLFAVLFLPLLFLKHKHSLSEGLHYLFLFAAASGLFGLQFLQRNIVEQMLPVMEHSFI